MSKNQWQFDDFVTDEYCGSVRHNDSNPIKQTASTDSRSIAIQSRARLPKLTLKQRVALVVAAQRIADDAAAALENLAAQPIDDEDVLRAFNITLDPSLDYDVEGAWVVVNAWDGSEVMGWRPKDGAAAGAVEAMRAIVDALDDPGVPFDFPGVLTCRPIAKREWPDTYRCRHCGSEDVEAAVWNWLNGPTSDLDADFFVDNVRRPGSRGVRCTVCEADETGVYGPGEGPESGTYPADQ